MSSLLNLLLEIIIVVAVAVVIRLLGNINNKYFGIFFTTLYALITYILCFLAMMSVILYCVLDLWFQIFSFPDWVPYRLAQVSIVVLILTLLIDYKKIKEYTNNVP